VIRIGEDRHPEILKIAKWVLFDDLCSPSTPS